MIGLFFNPQGRITPGQFWVGWAILLAIGVALNFVRAYAAPSTLGPLFGVVGLAMIYPRLCVYGKRFHDAGKSAWLFLAVVGVHIVVGIILVVVLVLPDIINMFSTIQDLQSSGASQGEIQAAQRQAQEEITAKTFIPAQIATVTVSVAIAYVVSSLRGDPEENRFGPPPAKASAGGAM